MKYLKSTVFNIQLFSVSILIVTILILNTENLLAQSFKNNRTLSFDSRYFTQEYSNKAVGQFGIDLMNLATLPGDLLMKTNSNSIKGENIFLFYDSKELRNVGRGLLTFIGSIFLSNSYGFAYHEYGHGTRAAAIGLKPYYGHGPIETEGDLQAALSGATKLYDNFFSFYLASLSNTRGFSIVKPGDTIFNPLEEELNNGWWKGLTSAGGLNNSMLFTEFVEDELYQNTGHLGFMRSYLNGKLAISNYGIGLGLGNDINNVTNYYQEKGFNVDIDRITKGSKISFYTSTLSYQFVYQLFNMFTGKSAHFKPWEIKGVQLPNTYFYMNRQGISYKINSGYRYQEWRFPVSVEYIYEGESQKEITLGAQKKSDKLTSSFEMILGNVFEFSLDASYNLNNKIILSSGYELYNRGNLHGERLIPSLEHGAKFHSIYLKASFAY